MKTVTNTFICVCAAVLLMLPASASAQSIAVIGAKLYTATGDQPIQNATIVIRDGKVVAVGASVEVPPGARVIDAHGKVVTPGFMNAGTQLGLVEIASTTDTSDQAAASGPLGAAFDVQYALNVNSTLIPLARADGLTRAGVEPSGSASAPFAGRAVSIALSPGGPLLDRPRSAMFVIISGAAAKQAGGSRSAAWALLRNALDEARLFPRGARPGAPRDQLLNHLDAEALQPVLSGQIPLAVVAARESDLREAVNLATEYKLRIVIFGGAEAWRLAPLLARHQIPVVLSPFDNTPATFDEIGSRSDNAALLNAAGVRIAFSVPGIHFSYNAGSGVREAAGIAVANGLPWIEGLKALTVNAAEIWGIADHYGTLAPGKDADLVIWDADPLEPSSAPVSVLVRGVSASLDTRQAALAKRYHPRNAGQTMPPGYR
jgi:imidazolonepropionase-like amidohydrolase